jgi:uncharacterized protein
LHELAPLCGGPGQRENDLNSKTFECSWDGLPKTLPVFPLPGALLLPGTQLPLNIFEPRYLNMVTDALGAGRLIGMIQPQNAAMSPEHLALSRVGCAGRITSFAETEDGRMLIVLLGVCRFAVAEELATTRGYRRVVSSWNDFAGDFAPTVDPFERARFMRLLRTYFRVRKLSADWQALEQLESWRLINVLSTSLPLERVDRQALLEASTVTERAQLLTGLLEMALVERQNVTEIRH